MTDPTPENQAPAHPSDVVAYAEPGTRTARPGRARPITQILLATVLLIFLAGQAYDILAFQEHWPYSRYSMYSTKKPKKTQVFEVWGIRAVPKGDSTEFKMQRSGEFIVPLAAIKRIYGTGKQSQVRKTRAAMTQFCEYYDRLRRQRNHPGPAIVGVRVYRSTFYLKDDAGNATRPDVRDLLVEAMLPTKRGKAATTTAPATQRHQLIKPGERAPGADPNDPFADQPGDDQ
jgi:hypothetical protein